MAHDNPVPKWGRIFIFLMVLAFLSMSCSSSDSQAGESKDKVASKTSQPCSDCPPANGIAAGSQAASGRRHLEKDVRSKSRRTAEEMAQTGEKLGDAFAKLEEASAEIPAETFDPQALVDKVGSGVEPLFQWVRDNTFLVSYRGSLRGPVGVLMDRLGNSLDRALLLHDLLGRAGHEARLAHGTLTEKQAGEVLEKAARPRPGLEASMERPLTASEKGVIEGYAAEFGLDKKTLFTAVEGEEKRRARLARSVSDGEKELTPRLMDLAAKYRKQDRDRERGEILEGIRDHWWVQVETESGTVDLDPSLPEAVPGKTLAKCSETKQPDELDDDLYHKVVLRVVIERWQNGQLKEQEALRHEFRPSEILGRRMTLGHASSGWPKLMDILRQNDPRKRLHDTILRQKAWTPVLKIGEEETRGSGFNDAGEFSADNAERKRPANPLGGLGAALSGGAAQTSAGGKSVLTAEWLEYEVRPPGRPARKVRREVFDLIGPAGRAAAEIPAPKIDDASRMKRSLALLGGTEILPLSCEWSEDYVRHLADGHLLAGQGTILSFYEAGGLKKPEEVLDKLGGLDRLPASLYLLARARHVPGGYLASPNILSLHSLFWEDGKGVLQRGVAVDIVDNRVAVVPGGAEDSFRTRLAQGVLDSVRESVFSGSMDGEDPLTKFYREADKNKIGWLVASSADDGALRGSELAPDLVARLRQATAEGDVVIAPRREVVVDGRPVVQWWRVDPLTGDALVFGEQGWGQAMPSYIQQVERIMQLKGWVELGADILKCALTGVVAAFGNDPKMDLNATLTCIQVILCNQLYNQFEDYCDLETNWTNFIIKQIAGYLAGEFCDLVSDDETWKGGAS